MAASIREQILQAIMATLAPVATAHGAALVRSPTAPLTDSQSPALVLLPEVDTVKPRSNVKTERVLQVKLIALARQTGRSGTAAESIADALLVDAHAALMTSAAIMALAKSPDEVECDFEPAVLTDVASAALPARYTLSYHTLAANIATKG